MLLLVSAGVALGLTALSTGANMSLDCAHPCFLESPRYPRGQCPFACRLTLLFLPAERLALYERTSEILAEQLCLRMRPATLLPCQLFQALLETLERAGKDLRLALGLRVGGRLRTAPLPSLLYRPLLFAGETAVLIPKSSRPHDPLVQLRRTVRPDP
jgi:hypothetical protein